MIPCRIRRPPPERTVAVLDILTPESRYTSEHRETCIRLLLAGVRQVSERLGLRGD